MMGAIRGQRAAFSCLSVNWFLDRVRWQPAHHPFALGAAPKGINQLAVSTQILASAMAIHVLRKQQAHPIKQENSCNIWTHSVRESTISAEDLIGYWGKNPVICAAPHLYLYWLEAAVRKSMMGIGSASLARFHSAKALIHCSALLDQIPFAVLVSCTVSESMTNINLLFLSERRSHRALE